MELIEEEKNKRKESEGYFVYEAYFSSMSCVVE